MAAVDEGDLAIVTELLGNPEVSVNVTNKVRRRWERKGGRGEGERES